MNKEFVLRGQTASGTQEVLNFSGDKPGYAYRLVELLLYPSADIHGQNAEHTASITAGKTAVSPIEPNFNDEGLIATAYLNHANGPDDPNGINYSVVNDTFLITQNLILMVQDSHSTATNWQCRFVAEKVNTAEGAVANYKQFTISDE